VSLVRAELLWDEVPDRSVYPYAIPAIAAIRGLDLSAPVTFFIGDNGSGKSTLLEAIAIGAGCNAEGGSRNMRFSNKATESPLHRQLRLVWERRPPWAFFLRAETFFDMASAYEFPDAPKDYSEPLDKLHQRSHGEQFIDAAVAKFAPGGFHLLDEPEAALSLHGQLKLLRRMHDLTERRAQFVVATHSPILLAFPGARIYAFGDDGLTEATYDDAEPVTLTRSFLDAPDRFLRHLFDDD
jgi:predicted ATPase